MPSPAHGIAVEDLEQVARIAEADLRTWRGGRLIVTGASGFFGSWLVETFHHANRRFDLGARLLGVGAPGEDFAATCPQLMNLDGVRLIGADIRHLRAELTRHAPDWLDSVDAIIHAAIHVDHKNFDRSPTPTLETGVLGTWEALEVARAGRARRFLFISSGAVYGAQPADVTRLAETAPCTLDCTNFRSAYGEGKRIGETLCAAYLQEHSISSSIARPFAFVGPYLPLRRQFAIGNFIGDTLAGGPIVINSGGSALRSYLYAADLAIWLWALLARGAPGRAYNVGDEREYSLAEVARVIAATAIPPLSVEILGKPETGPPSRYIPATLRAREELGLVSTVDLTTSVERTLALHRRRI